MISAGGLNFVVGAASEATDARPATASRGLRPVTERVLAELPGPRLLWIVVWAAVPWLNAGANLLLDTGERSAAWEQSRLVVILNYAALSFAVVVTLLGAERIARRVEKLGATTSKVLTGTSPSRSFREMNSRLAPLLAVAATALAFGLSALIQDGWTAAVVRGATWFVLGVPIWSFLWTYGSLQLGLNRLGRAHLRDDASLVDPSLGLRPLGSVAFMGLWLLLVWMVPGW